jgi:HEAT repeat protein
MKRALFLAIVLCFTVVMAHAAANAPILTDAAGRMYIMALKSDNVGLRNSAIFELAKIRSQCDYVDLTEYEKVLKKLSSVDNNHLIRMNAQLTLTYLQDKELSDKIKVQDDEDPFAFYTRLHETINQDFYAAK